QLADGHPERAVEALQKILELPFPAGAPEGEDTLLDARARLAKLLLAQGRADDARRIVDQGLASATRDSFFLANLWSVSGELHEARDAKHAAIEAYQRSIEINQRIQKRLAEENRP